MISLIVQSVKHFFSVSRRLHYNITRNPQCQRFFDNFLILSVSTNYLAVFLLIWYT